MCSKAFQIGAVYFLTIILILVSSRYAFSCPPACGHYDIYYLVVSSGHDQEEVVTSGMEISKKLNSTLVVAGSDSRSRFEKCHPDRTNCLALVASDDELIGKTSWTPEEVSRGEMEKKTYAVAYLFDSYQTGQNKKRATERLKLVRKTVKDAYLKAVPQCACE